MKFNKLRELCFLDVFEYVSNRNNGLIINTNWVAAVFADECVAIKREVLVFVYFFAITACPYFRRPSEPCSPSGSCGHSIYSRLHSMTKPLRNDGLSRSEYIKTA
jgi:hypothetical protein